MQENIPAAGEANSASRTLALPNHPTSGFGVTVLDLIGDLLCITTVAFSDVCTMSCALFIIIVGIGVASTDIVGIYKLKQ